MKEIELKNIKGISHITIDVDKKRFFILGENGSGKTTIVQALYILQKIRCSKIDGTVLKFAELEQGLQDALNNLLPVEGSKNESSIKIEDNNGGTVELSFIKEKITSFSDNSPILLHIYNKFFVEDEMSSGKSFSDGNSMQKTAPVFNVDKSTDELPALKNELSNLIGKSEDTLPDKETQYAYENKIKDIYNVIKDDLSTPIKKWTKWATIEDQLTSGEHYGGSVPSDNLKTEYTKLSDGVEIEVEAIKPIQCEISKELLEEINGILKTEYSVIKEDRFKDFKDEWLRETAKHIKDNDNCPVCCQDITKGDGFNAVLAFKKYCDDEGGQAKIRLRDIGCKFNDYIKKYEESFSKIDKAKIEMQGYRASLKNTDNIDYDLDVSGLSDTIDKLNISEKIRDITKPFWFDVETTIKVINDYIKQYDKFIFNFNKCLEALKKKSQDVTKLKSDIKIEIAESLLKEAVDRLNKSNFYMEQSENKEQIRILREEVELVETKSSNNCINIKNHKECYNHFLKKFGMDKYALNDDCKLAISSGGGNDIDKRFEHVLSEGEMNIIALAYYYISLFPNLKSKEDINNIFFILDDPVTSFDYKNFYSVCNVVTKYNEVYQYDTVEPYNFFNKGYMKQYMICTHDIHLYTLIRQNIEKSKDKSSFKKIENRKIEDCNISTSSYLRLFLIDIKSAVDDNTILQEKPHTIGSTLRSILEIFKSIECDGRSNSAYVESKRCSEIDFTGGNFSFLNSECHGYADKLYPPEATLKSCCEMMLKFAEKYHGIKPENIN